MKIVIVFYLLLNSLSAMELKERALAPRANECQLCHIKRKKQEVFHPSVGATKREHFEIELSHGKARLSCNDCHDVNNSNKLFLPASFKDTSILCSRCHSEHFTKWQNGLHGKRIGSWKNNVLYHCIDCHNSHSVSIKKIQAKPAPSIQHKR